MKNLCQAGHRVSRGFRAWRCCDKLTCKHSSLLIQWSDGRPPVHDEHSREASLMGRWQSTTVRAECWKRPGGDARRSVSKSSSERIGHIRRRIRYSIEDLIWLLQRAVLPGTPLPKSSLIKPALIKQARTTNANVSLLSSASMDTCNPN